MGTQASRPHIYSRRWRHELVKMSSVLLAHIGATRARGHARLLLARPQCTAPLASQRACREPQRGGIVSRLRARWSRRWCAGVRRALSRAVDDANFVRHVAAI